MGKTTEIDAEVFYYVKTKKNQLKATVCLALKGKIISRGVAICSESEIMFNKSKGRKIAKGRAIKAFVEKTAARPIRRKEAYDSLDQATGFYRFRPIFKSEFKADPLNEFEQNLINNLMKGDQCNPEIQLKKKRPSKKAKLAAAA